MGRGHKNKPRQKATPPPPPASSSGGTALLLLAGLAVGGGLAACAYLYNQSRQSRTAAESRPASIADNAIPERPAHVSRDLASLLGRLEQRVRSAPSDAERHAELGLAYEANHMWPQAAACYARATRIDPDEWLWPLHHATALIEVGATADALRVLRSAGARFPNASPLQHRLGVLLLEHGLLDDAETALVRARTAQPQASAVLTDIADLRLCQDRPVEAIALLEEALRLDAHSTHARYVLGLAYRAVGRSDEARRFLAEGASSQRSHIVDRWSARIPEFELGLLKQLERAQTMIGTPRTPEAVIILERISRTAPDNVDILVNLGVAYNQVQRHSAALDVLRRCLDLDEDGFAVHINLAATYLSLDQPAPALVHIDRAIALAPELAHPRLVRGRTLRRLDRNDDAFSAFLEARRLDPMNGDAHAELGQLCLDAGRFEDARAHLAELVRLRPGQWQAHLHLAYASHQAQAHAAAAEALEAAERLSPDNPEVHRLRAWIEDNR